MNSDHNGHRRRGGAGHAAIEKSGSGMLASSTRRTHRFRPETSRLEARQLMASVAVRDVQVTEVDPGAGTAYAEFAVVLSDWRYGSYYTVSYGTRAGSAIGGRDFVPSSGSLSFDWRHGIGPTLRTVRIPLVADGTGESTENFFLRLSGASSNLAISDSSGEGRILDDDTPTVSISPSQTVAENGGATRVTVSLTNPSDLNVTVSLAASSGTALQGRDFVAPPTTVTFAPGSELSRTIPVDIIDNSSRDGDRAFTLSLSNPSNAFLGRRSCAVTITDDETPPPPPPPVPSVTIGPGVLAVGERSGSASLTVALSNAHFQPVSVVVFTSDGSARLGSDYVAKSSTLVFQPGQTTLTFNVAIVDDPLHEEDESFAIGLSGVVNAVLVGGRTASTITIRDDDPAVVRDSPGVYRGGTYYLDMDTFGYQGTDPTASYGGSAGDVPVVGDWDGDGYDEPGIFRTVDGQTSFFLDTGLPGWQPTDQVIAFGLPGDQPVIGDWDGDRRDNVGIFRVVGDFTYFALDLGDPGYQASDLWVQYGVSTDQPVAGDWDGDGRDEVGIYRAGLFYLDTGARGYQSTDTVIAFGRAGDIPVIGDWDGDGRDNVGVFQNLNGTTYFAMDVGLPGYRASDLLFQFGLPGDRPVAGRWRRR